MGILIGHKTTLHVFRSRQRYEAEKLRLSKKGRITEIFVNNRYAFEVKQYKKIQFVDPYLLLPDAQPKGAAK